MKSTTIAILGAAIIIGGAIVLTSRGGPTTAEAIAPANNVTIVDGKQIITIQVKGGYTPKKSTAKLGVPTILRFTTNGTFDCTSGVRIPSMGISKTLPSTGTTDIDRGSPTVATLQGVCSMGMYPFEVDFQG